VTISASSIELSDVEISSNRPIVGPLDFSLSRGERVALIGASGAGKSLTALAFLALLPSGLHFSSGDVRFDGISMLDMHEKERVRIRGRRIGLVFQEGLERLNPVWTVGFQLMEILGIHRPGPDIRERAREILASLDLDVDTTMNSYPHQLSGGQRQRVLLALASAPDPDFLIADEMTSSLDLETRALVEEQLHRRCRESGVGLLLISHDLASVEGRVDRVVVMDGGVIIEESPAADFFSGPLHPLSCRMTAAARGETMSPVKFRDSALPGGCPSLPRCPDAREECRFTTPGLRKYADTRRCRCLFVRERQ